MTLSEILQECYDDAGYGTAPDSRVVARIKRYVNEGVRHILGEPGLSRLLDSDTPLTIASVASQARYVVPEAAAQIRGVSERTNDRTLGVMSFADYRHRQPDPTASTGTPTHYVPIGKVAVALQPGVTAGLWVYSNLDTSVAYVEGIITGGYRRSTSVTLSADTSVALPVTFIEVEDFYISTAGAGTVVLRKDTDTGTELARITAGQLRPRYTAFALWPTPAAVVDYLVDYRRELLPLVNLTDEPPLPTDYHTLLSTYARMRHYEREADARYGVTKEQFAHDLSRLKYATQTSAGELPVVGARRMEHSRLGAQYPADVWTRG